MSRRRPIAQDLEANLVVRSLALGLPAGVRIEPHEHVWPQLVYADRGVMTVTTEQGTWVVPPERAIWVRPSVEHEIDALGEVALRTLYLEPSLADGLPLECAVFQVTRLLRELILETVRGGYLDRRVPEQLRFAQVIRDQLECGTKIPAELPQPRDPRARSVAAKVVAEPGGRKSLESLAKGSGAAPRTIERIFSRETSMTFRRWRQQARLLHAIGLLAEGHSVTEVALRSGYESTSAFISMFRRSLGTTPGRYFGEAQE